MRKASPCGVRGSWDSFSVQAGNGPSSPDEVGNTGLFSSCGGKLSIHLKWWQGSLGPLALYEGSQVSSRVLRGSQDSSGGVAGENGLISR